MLPLLLACTSALEVVATVAPASPTVITLAWSGEDVTAVTYGPTDDRALTADVASGATSVDLFGLPAETDVWWEVVADGRRTTRGVTRTGSLPADFPTVSVTVDEPGRSEEAWWFGALFEFLGARPRVAALDRATGEWVWVHEGDEGMITVNAQRVAGSGDVLFNQFDAAFGEDSGNLRRVNLRGERVGEWHTPLAHHMFAQLPDGTLTFQSLDIRPWTDPETGDTEDLIGDRVMELDPETGAVTEVFTIWDWLEPTWNRHWDGLSIYPDGIDWTHGNAIKYREEEDAYLLSLGHASVLVDFARSDGAVRAMYGQAGIPVAEGELVFDYQHDPTWNADGTLSMFTTNLEADAAGAITYALRDGALHEVWSHDVHDGDLRPIALGQVTHLENGNTLIGYGAEGVLREVTPEGEVVWEAVTEQGFANGQLMAAW